MMKWANEISLLAVICIIHGNIFTDGTYAKNATRNNATLSESAYNQNRTNAFSRNESNYAKSSILTDNSSSTDLSPAVAPVNQKENLEIESNRTINSGGNNNFSVSFSAIDINEIVVVIPPLLSSEPEIVLEPPVLEYEPAFMAPPVFIVPDFSIDFQNDDKVIVDDEPVKSNEIVLKVAGKNNSRENTSSDSRTKSELIPLASAGRKSICRTGQLCGYPIYIVRGKCNSGSNSCNLTLGTCQVNWQAVLFGLMDVLIGLTTLVTNSLVLAVIIRNPQMRSHYYYIKASLAVADVIVGFLMLFVVLPNMVWINNVTDQELQQYLITHSNSPTAVAIGALLLVSIQASLLHLLFLSTERFLAIRWPFWHMGRKTRTIFATLAAIWTISIITSLIPAFFPDYFEYQLQPPLLIYMLSMKSSVDSASATWRAAVYSTFALILPYVLTAVVCILTATTSVRKMNASKKYFKADAAVTSSTTTNNETTALNNKGKPKPTLKPEVAVFVTIVTMIVTFSITFLPFGIVFLFQITGVLNCNNYTVPYVTTFYIGMMNSFTNGIIYSIRDINFRRAVAQLFGTKRKSNSGLSQSDSHNTTRTHV